MENGKDLTAIGLEILSSARNELYLNLPYMDAALCGLRFQPGGGKTLFTATNGEELFYDGNYLAERFLRSRNLVNRIYLHSILHCMLRHLRKKRGRDPELWDLSCDIAVESILDSLEVPCLELGVRPTRGNLYGDLRRELPVLTAEGIYRCFLRRKLPPFERARLQKEFFADDHVLWDPQGQEDQNQRQDQKWQSVSERTQTGLETVLAGKASGGEAVYEQVKVANREGVDYRRFLRRFAVPREVMAVDGDAFDYGFYSYGLRLYGNMPLVEPPETREEKRIQDFVIAVDTSMSTSGELVREFLSCTYSILRSTETFSQKVNIRLLQCDDQIRSDTVLHDLKDLESLMNRFQLTGGSATDFRPVFAYVDQLRAEGAFSHLRGLIYFTDGMGVYPQKRPPYETAFVMMEDPLIHVEVPPWAIRLTLTEPELEKAVRDSRLSDEADIDDLAELPIL